MKQCIALMMLIAAIVGGAATLSANTYIIDGNVDDWHIDLSAASSAGYLDSHLPSGGLDIDVVHEDTIDASKGQQYVGPGYSYQNLFDAEALYADNDATNLYIAIVTGFPFAGSNVPWGSPWFLPGDIGISTDGNNSVYEYALDVSSYDAVNKKATFYQGLTAQSWNQVMYQQFAESNPWAVKTGLLNNNILVDFVYSYVQNTHYVLEAKIPLASLGLTPADHSSIVRSVDIHWTMQCGNDSINLRADVNPTAPEPASMALLLIGLAGGAGRIYLRKKNNG